MPQSRRAFTLIEVLVVTVMAAAIMTALVVSIGGTRDRTFNLVRDQVADLLLTYALRAEFSDVPIGIEVDHDAGQLRLVRRVEIDDRPAWIRDTSFAPIRLPDWIETRNIDFFADGERVDPGYKPLTALPGQTRPRIELILRADTGKRDREVTLLLPPQAIRPLVLDPDLRQTALFEREPIDLDATGHWQEDW
jgi:prepilin-type N-terminal cleavage/methylation domain-containing protein